MNDKTMNKKGSNAKNSNTKPQDPMNRKDPSSKTDDGCSYSNYRSQNSGMNCD